LFLKKRKKGQTKFCIEIGFDFPRWGESQSFDLLTKSTESLQRGDREFVFGGVKEEIDGGRPK
jgi:hypothetical protein